MKIIVWFNIQRWWL